MLVAVGISGAWVWFHHISTEHKIPWCPNCPCFSCRGERERRWHGED